MSHYTDYHVKQFNDKTEGMCDMSYYSAIEDMQADCGGESYTVEDPLSSFATIVSLLGVTTMQEAIQKWPSLADRFPEALYLKTHKKRIEHQGRGRVRPYCAPARARPRRDRAVARHGPAFQRAAQVAQRSRTGRVAGVQVPERDRRPHAVHRLVRPSKRQGAGHQETKNKDAFYYGTWDFPCIELPVLEFMNAWAKTFNDAANLDYFSWDTDEGVNLKYRFVLCTLLTEREFKSVEDAIKVYPCLRDDMIEDMQFW